MSYNPGGSGSGSIAGSSDVALSNPTGSDLLAYNGTLAKWQNQASDQVVPFSNMVGAVGPYTGTPPPRPSGFAFVIWNGDTDPGANAVDGDLGVGW